MDRPAVEITEKFSGAGYPLDVEALLIVEVDGTEEEIATQFARIRAVAAPHKPVTVRESQSAEEAARIWMGRKAAFGAMGRLSDYLCMDGVIPTGRLPDALRGVAEISDRHGLRVANIFHAGDGNLHPSSCSISGIPNRWPGPRDAGPRSWNFAWRWGDV